MAPAVRPTVTTGAMMPANQQRRKASWSNCWTSPARCCSPRRPTAYYYRFDNLAVGSYQVRIPASEFAVGGKLSSYASSTGQDTAFAATDNNHDHGDDAELNGVKSAVVIASANNPTGEADSGATGAGSNGPSGDATTT
ncbi:MAG: hypothetical protein U0350_16255 [Caldilineaceae bacterium]